MHIWRLQWGRGGLPNFRPKEGRLWGFVTDKGEGAIILILRRCHMYMACYIIWVQTTFLPVFLLSKCEYPSFLQINMLFLHDKKILLTCHNSFKVCTRKYNNNPRETWRVIANLLPSLPVSQTLLPKSSRYPLLTIGPIEQFSTIRGRTLSTYALRARGRGSKSVRSRGGCVNLVLHFGQKSVQKGRGVKNPKKFAYVVNKWPLMTDSKSWNTKPRTAWVFRYIMN